MTFTLTSNTLWVAGMQGCQSNSLQTTVVVHISHGIHTSEAQGVHGQEYRLAFCKSPGLVDVDGVVNHMCQ